MAEVAEMGEVDELHSKEDGVVLNGEVSNDVDMESQDSSQEILKKTSLNESMEVDEDSDNENTENSDTKEGNHEIGSNSEDSNDNSAEVSSVASGNSSVDDENSQESKASESQDEQNENQDEQNENQDKQNKNQDKQNENQDEQNKIQDDQNKKQNDGSERDESEKNPDEEEEVEEEEEIVDEPEPVDTTNLGIKEKDEDEKENDLECDKKEDKKKVKTEDESSKEKSGEEIHEITDDDEDHSKIKPSETIELNDSGGECDDVMIVDPPKENGTSETEVIDLDCTPEKEKPSKESITPRRSSRNLNKNKSYVESDKEDTPPPPPREEESEESDIEEVLPQDPLAVGGDAITVERIPAAKPKSVNSSTIVVKDTKRLVEIASKSNNVTTGKKEPTLVIIDTNSILSGRGPVPVINKSPAISTSSFTPVLPVALPAQGMYPPNMRATITPIPINSASLTSSTPQKSSPATITPSTPLLPTLTDDMFVVEAPSFIVPYVYEKPPVKDFKEFVKDIKTAIQAKIKEEESKSEESKSKDNKVKNDDEKMETDDDIEVEKKDESKKPYSYFESPLGKFFIDIGVGLVQEFVQSDLLKQQKRKRDRERGENPETNRTIQSLVKNLEFSKENNEPFKMPIKKCEFCNFKTESALAMAYHLETPHMKNFVYKCNFCPYEVRSPHDILFHMEAEHAVRGHLERAPAFHQCPNCPFEDNQKGKLSRHLVACMRKFKPERNLEPPIDWEPPAKIPRVPKMRQQGLNATAAAYQAMSKTSQYQFLSKMQLQSTNSALSRGRGRPQLGPNVKPQQVLRPSGMVFKQSTMSGGSVLVPTNYQLSGNQVFQNSSQGKKASSQPSISITPLPRGTTATPAVSSKPGDTNSKNSFVICEICDGYIKDLEQLRNHMQWIHKIKIHPKMIYNRPPLNCQKCQFRFFTDQGLERHLLGSHGLVTSSMQDAANKSKDSGRCPVCGRVYQWKLLNHVARDHNMTLKPAHLSYKCTVCTATFGMYKQFENHVYSAHSVVAKRVMDKKSASSSPSATNKADVKPLKINDEITIIPQPAKSTNGASKEGSPSSTGSPSTSKSR